MENEYDENDAPNTSGLIDDWGVFDPTYPEFDEIYDDDPRSAIEV